MLDEAQQRQGRRQRRARPYLQETSTYLLASLLYCWAEDWLSKSQSFPAPAQHQHSHQPSNHGSCHVRIQVGRTERSPRFCAKMTGSMGVYDALAG